ncbi:hypothetical protein JQ557_07700 [Bradyrhizobium sp. U87765 SZCCT0131]|uniref:hypothetical protein n=1 Tax=unclassified Bradyrhizobium TaxID=2631580 RepID=UPI001BAB48EF|nr:MULTISPECIES: hypothetical protein [unclassified Bradyrhizobium]MBR1217868.1 hypothetical protein [Bradyrhizobium sp. U87765 SZCCT0131]MBR1261186.1 hypothetical protein [Bradyrhizobium sp. U87765 SZCCT0134]MBR1303366.1 hypothetical protein [Bradyrhizobium sp. U87765 SZCCT0110]MBR1318972.1 hypothetical protein [Bradyrhizobium sp. U87765 SZCCT0109]MBR1347297.1 hypothetical protein [Bradyrhizobium sp. U87765 SZCCT0048]
MTGTSFVLRSTWLVPLMLIVSILYVATTLCAILIGLGRELIMVLAAAPARLHGPRSTIGARRIRA